MFILSLLQSSVPEVDWSRPLMIGWLVIALGLGAVELWLAGGFSSRTRSGDGAERSTSQMVQS